MLRFALATLLCAAAAHTAHAASTVLVDDYGARGDGATWDHKAIQAAMDAAGPGGIVEFSPGKVYVQCAQLLPLPRQIIRGNGATLKRCDALVALLTAPASAGDTILRLDKPQIFERGWAVTPVRGAGAREDGEYGVAHWVDSVGSSSIEILNGLLHSYPAGSPVVVKFDQISIQNSSTGVTIESLTFDGNRSHNGLYRTWTDNHAIRGYSGLMVRNNAFLELPGNGVMAFGTNVTIDSNRFTGLDGPIVHLSGNDPVDGSSVTISNNQAEDTNREFARMGHSEGVITISVENNSIRVLDNVVRNAPVPFVGEFHEMMQDWQISGNRVSGTAGAFTANSAAGPQLRNVVFDRNAFVDVGPSWTYGPPDAAPITGFIFRRNKIIGGSVVLSPLENSRVAGNTIKDCGFVPLEVPDGPNVTVRRNTLADDYCLISAAIAPATLKAEAPAADVSYQLDLVDTEDEDAPAGVAITGISTNSGSALECGQFPIALEAGQSISCTMRGRVAGRPGQIIEDTVRVIASTTGGREFETSAPVHIQLVDTTPPRLVLRGPFLQTIRQNSAYVELGAVATDAVDGDLTASISTDASSLVMSQPGSYVVTYVVSDAAGNTASAQRIVSVTRGGGGATDALSLSMLALFLLTRCRRRVT